jgi:hypothetical protein
MRCARAFDTDQIAGARVDTKKRRSLRPQYNPETWKEDDGPRRQIDIDVRALAGMPPHQNQLSGIPDIRQQTLILDLLGRINYKILSGKRVYIEVGGVVYKTLYGGYWRSVFTGLEHYLLRCEQVSDAVWSVDDPDAAIIDLPIAYSNGGWTAKGNSLSFMLSRDWS